MNRRTLLLGIAAVAVASPVALSIASNADGSPPGFAEALKAGEPILVHITAAWCGECKRQRPIVARLMATPDFAKVRKFDIDFDTDKPALAYYKVQHQSTIIAYKGGKEMDRLTGVTDPAVIETLMRKVID